MSKVLFIMPSAYLNGGVQDWLDYMIAGLSAKHKHVVAGIVSSRFHDVRRYLATHDIENFIEIKSSTGTKFNRVNSLIETITEVNPDFVISVNIVDVYHAVAKMKRERKFTARFVAVLHGFHLNYMDSLRTFSKIIDGVIVTNRLTELLVREIKTISPERIHYAPYGVPVPDQSKPSNHQKLIIGFAGRLEQPQKRVGDLPLIVKQLIKLNIDFELHIAGDGPEYASLSQVLAGEIENGTVRLLGWLDSKSLTEQVYKIADIFVITSSWETGPIIAWEAMAYGVPVVSSKYIGHLSENALKHNENCLLFEIGDAEQAAELIVMLSDNELRDRIRQNAYQTFLARYTCDISISKFDQALTKISQLGMTNGIIGDEWPKAGKLEQYLGHQIADKLRQYLGKAAYSNTAGDEWPNAEPIKTVNHEQHFRLICELEKIPASLESSLAKVCL